MSPPSSKLILTHPNGPLNPFFPLAKAGVTADKQKTAAGKTTSAKGKKGLSGPFGWVRINLDEGGDIDTQMNALMESGETHTMPDGTEMPGATHEEYEKEMLPDEEMESDYLDFILDEALDEEEENFLMEQLESNDELSLIFDKVIDVASEFAGSGPVDGPGSGVSDSIPARLSDGEFVITAKATEEIGADRLMSMMKEAEAAADTRQPVAYGGMIDEEDGAIPLPTQGS
jgi:hypothetical protein